MKLRAAALEIVNAGRLLVQSQFLFKDIAQRFLDVRVPQLGFATQNKYRTQIQNHILPALGDLRVCDIDRPLVEQWLHSKASEGLGWWSRADLKGILSAIFTTAKNWNLWTGANPTEGIRIGKKKLVREKRLLTAAEVMTILGALKEPESFILLILVVTGLRISEVLGLRWSDVDLEKGTLTVRRRWYRGDLSEEGTTKTDNSLRTIELGSLVSKFAQHRSATPGAESFIFVGDDGIMPPDDRDLLRYGFRPVVKRVKLYYPGFGWHAFRRQNISWRQHVGGATPLEAQKAAGHGSLDMTYLYTLSDTAREKAQVNAILDHLFGTGPSKPQ